MTEFEAFLLSRLLIAAGLTILASLVIVWVTAGRKQIEDQKEALNYDRSPCQPQCDGTSLDRLWWSPPPRR